MHLESGSNDSVIITSAAGSSNGSDVQLNFFFPKHCAQKFNHFSVYEDFAGNKFLSWELLTSTSDPIKAGNLQDVSSFSPSKYFFIYHKQIPTSIAMQTSMGEIIKHSGDANSFETTVAITNRCVLALEKAMLKTETTEVRKLQTLCNSELHMTIVYPYPIQPNTHIKLSKKKKTIVVTSERAISCSYTENPINYVDCNNALVLPRIQNGDRRIKLHFTLQTPLPTVDPASLFYMKKVLFHLAHMASDEHVVVAFPSKHIPGNPDIYGMIIIHGIHFDPYFQSVILNISFCFPEPLSKSAQIEVIPFWGELTRSEFCVVWVDDEKYKILNEALPHFTTTCRKKHGNPGIPPALTKHKGWKYFQQALIHPLYPNTQLPHVKDSIKSFPSKFEDSDILSGMQSYDTSLDVEQQCVNKCTYCEQMHANLKKCGRCGKVQYCGKECQIKDWKEHKIVCKTTGNVTVSTLFHCANCKKKTNLSRCSCQIVAYCSKECQKLDWPNHQNSCTSRTKASVKPTESSVADQSHQSKQSSQSQCKASFVEPNNARMQKSGKCSNCNKAVFQQLNWCPCHKAAYCSIECQRLNWPLHKGVCTSMKK